MGLDSNNHSAQRSSITHLKAITSNRGTHGDSLVKHPAVSGSSQEAPSSNAVGVRRREYVTCLSPLIILLATRIIKYLLQVI
ncbi:MAG: hypothetical protein LBU04_02180 [Christensenellaceae bacterium]|nr:hypothetical protein [Christensenellaceae bacterium]